MAKKLQKSNKAKKEKTQKISKKHSKQQSGKHRKDAKIKQIENEADKVTKLPRGRKLCHNCKALLYIHQSICPSCKSVHHMKRSKQEILKSLAKNQPKALRGILQSNQFNQLTKKQTSYKFAFEIQGFKQSFDQKYIDKDLKVVGTKQKLGYNIYYSENPKICVQKVGNNIIFVQIVKGSRKQINRKPSFYEQITIKAFQLDCFHKVGAQYTAKSYISCFSILKEKVSYRILIEQDIFLMKSFMNRSVCLTGRGSIFIVNLPDQSDIQNLAKSKQATLCLQPKDLHEISQKNEFFTTFTILRSSFDIQNVCFNICVGTLSGNIIIYKVSQDMTALPIRVYANVHYEHITCISECPLSNLENCIFCSGSYDGSVKVWNLNQTQNLFSVEVSNKKVVNLIWDFGAKFILAIRDEMPQNCIMICFYSVFRTEDTMNLSNETQLRPIKIPNSSYLSHSDQSQKILPIVDTVECKLYLLSTEELRKSSLKKKKHTQQKKMQKFNIKIKLLKDCHSQDILEVQKLKSRGKSRSKGVSKIRSEQQKQEQIETQPLSRFFKGFPVVSDLKHYLQIQNGETVNYVYGTTYKGHIFQFKLLPSDLSQL